MSESRSDVEGGQGKSRIPIQILAMSILCVIVVILAWLYHG